MSKTSRRRGGTSSTSSPHRLAVCQAPRCPLPGGEFEPRRRDQRYCSDPCKLRAKRARRQLGSEGPEKGVRSPHGRAKSSSVRADLVSSVEIPATGPQTALFVGKADRRPRTQGYAPRRRRYDVAAYVKHAKRTVASLNAASLLDHERTAIIRDTLDALRAEAERDLAPESLVILRERVREVYRRYRWPAIEVEAVAA
jgi:hypothetical protein